jgi:hypothetical protein
MAVYYKQPQKMSPFGSIKFCGKEETMERPFVASTKYGDLKGTVSVDGFEGPFLDELSKKANIPEGYIPVGLTFHLGKTGTYDQGEKKEFIRFSLVAARADESNFDVICREATSTSKMNVYSFDLDGVNAEEILALVKRVDIKLIHYRLQDINIMEYEDPLGPFYEPLDAKHLHV